MGKKIDLDDLSASEKAALPGRIRALDRDEHLREWAAAKAERDAGLEALYETVQEERTDEVGNAYVVSVRRFKDPETGPAQADAIRATWAGRKAELIAAAPSEE